MADAQSASGASPMRRSTLHSLNAAISTMSGRIRSLWASLSGWHRFFLLIKVAAALLTSWWLFRTLPPPGYAIGVVAVVAAVLTFQEHMHGWQKAIWMILIGVLLIVEMRSIKVDRARADAQALQDRENQDNNFRLLRQREEQQFAATLGGLKDQFSATISGFDTSRRLENQLFGSLLREQTRLFSGMQQSTQDTLNALTGGDSYGVISPLLMSESSGKAEYDLMISVRGKNTLWDVRVEMKEGSPIDPQFGIKEYLSGKLRKSVNLGAVSTTYSQPTGWVVTPTADKVNTYFFWIWSRTKLTTEEIDIRYNSTSNVWENLVEGPSRSRVGPAGGAKVG
jgi:hypothetical protein